MDKIIITINRKFIIKIEIFMYKIIGFYNLSKGIINSNSLLTVNVIRIRIRLRLRLRITVTTIITIIMVTRTVKRNKVIFKIKITSSNFENNLNKNNFNQLCKIYLTFQTFLFLLKFLIFLRKKLYKNLLPHQENLKVLYKKEKVKNQRKM